MILDKILDTKEQEIVVAQRAVPITRVAAQAAQMPPARGFLDALRARGETGRIGVIAEIKKASPSQGLIRPDFDPVQIAKQYESGGATCLSVLTDRDHFQGHDDFLVAVREAVSLPVLRKDFVIDEYQVYETRALGADCILLIVAAVPDRSQLHELFELSVDLGLDVLMEVHDERELDRALATGVELIGINNRDLNTFKTDLNTSRRLAKQIPSGHVVVSESGIGSIDDVEGLRRHNIHHYLIGESLMRADDPGQALAELIDEAGIYSKE